MIFQHDNARPSVAKPIKETFEALNWDVSITPAVFSRIALSDYHLFRSMTHSLSEQRFHSYEDIKKWIDSWIASKDVSFFRRGIHLLPEKWEKVMAIGQ